MKRIVTLRAVDWWRIKAHSWWVWCRIEYSGYAIHTTGINRLKVY